MMELLAPAGNLEKLKIAVQYGADAVYFGGEEFSLRAGAGGLSNSEIIEGMDYLHQRGKKGYLTLNIFPHNEDIEPLKKYINSIKNIPIDAYIMSDLGAISILKDIIPGAEVHLSTQANTTNYMTAKIWFELGIKRLVLARELSLKEIKELREKIPKEMELEAFVHGAMCISYSGRCLLSNFMVERDANRGECAHPCRWNYALEEEKRPGEYYPIEEDNRGTYIMNSKDLCMIDEIQGINEAGITSLKIEGRMKSIFYVATVIGAYRKAMDDFTAGRDFDASCQEELYKVSNRGFTKGFYYGQPNNNDQNYSERHYNRDYTFIGLVKDYDAESKMATVEQRNKMVLGEEIEVIGPASQCFQQKIEILQDEEGNNITEAPHAQQILKIKMAEPVKENYILRRRNG
ncbi:MAG: peptidase U32 family protein [Anaerovoracaceae bacterium]